MTVDEPCIINPESRSFHTKIQSGDVHTSEPVYMFAPHLTNVEQVRTVQKQHRKGTTESLMLTVEVQYIDV